MKATFNKIHIFLILVTSIFYFNICDIPSGVGEIYINDINHTSPESFTLENNSLLLIYEDGFFLYDSEFGNEKMILNITLNTDDIGNVLIKQYPSSDDGYILILLKNILYFFDSSLVNYNQQNITFTGNIQNLILIKKENNSLYYTINSYIVNNPNINIYYYRYNLNSQSNELIYPKEYVTENGLSTANCILMIPSNKNIKLITCFYYNFQSKFYSTSFDLEKNLKKINNG